VPGVLLAAWNSPLAQSAHDLDKGVALDDHGGGKVPVATREVSGRHR